jgi:hypothetical protein
VSDRDFVTVLRVEGDRANKLVSRGRDGTITKSGAVEGGSYVAQTVPAPNADAIAAILADVGSDPRMVLCLGIFKDAGPDRFLIWSRKRIARALGLDPGAMTRRELRERTKGWHLIGGERIASRTKDNTTLGSWTLLDRDLVQDMPQELADLGFEGWLAAMCDLVPTLDRAALVVVPSTSGRVLVDGRPWSSKPSWHAYFQVDDPDDLRNRVWPQILVKSFATRAPGADVPLGFMRLKRAKDGSGRVLGRQAWSIYDPSTLWPERLVYDGAPTVKGKGLSLAAPDVRVEQRGGRVAAAAFADVPREQARPAERLGVKVQRRPDGSGLAAQFVTAATLNLDLELDTEDGPKTVRRLWLDDAGHVRCQSPFRESSSWAAYFGQHDDGLPFLFDTGADCKYTLAPECRAGPEPAEFVSALEAWIASVGSKVEGPEQIKAASGRVRNAITAAIRHGWEQSAVDVLTEQLAATMAKPFGQAKSRLAQSFRRDAKKAAKAVLAGDATEEQDELVERLNERYAVVNFGGSVKIAELDVFDPCLGRKHVRVMGKADFELALANETVKVGDKTLPAAGFWLRHPDRRQHLGGVTLDPAGKLGPEYLNTWRGFGVDPCEGDPGPFLDHIKLVASGNGPDAERYLVGWLARKVQLPGEQAETAIMLRGTQGVGKGALGHAMCRIFGGHAMHISQSEHLVGKFNSHLLDCCLLFADEAFFAGDRRHVSVLKALITEGVIAVEPKFVNAFQARNRLGVIMASNDDFVVPAGRDERRFFCLDVPDSRKGDRAYFKRYFDAVADPKQLGAFLRWLLDRDLRGFEVRDVPQTATLLDQKIAALGEPERWLLSRLHLGTFPGVCGLERDDRGMISRGWPDWLATQLLYDDYQQVTRMNGQPRFMLNAVQFGQFMGRYYPCTRPRNEKSRLRGYQFGSLDEARAAFEAYHGLEGMDWGASLDTE